MFFDNTQDTSIKFRHEVYVKSAYACNLSVIPTLVSLKTNFENKSQSDCFSFTIVFYRIAIGFVPFQNLFRSYSQGNGFTIKNKSEHFIFPFLFQYALVQMTHLVWDHIFWKPRKLILRFQTLNSCINNNYLLFIIQGGWGGGYGMVLSTLRSRHSITMYQVT